MLKVKLGYLILFRQFTRSFHLLNFPMYPPTLAIHKLCYTPRIRNSSFYIRADPVGADSLHISRYAVLCDANVQRERFPRPPAPSGQQYCHPVTPSRPQPRTPAPPRQPPSSTSFHDNDTDKHNHNTNDQNCEIDGNKLQAHLKQHEMRRPMLDHHILAGYLVPSLFLYIP